MKIARSHGFKVLRLITSKPTGCNSWNAWLHDNDRTFDTRKCTIQTPMNHMTSSHQPCQKQHGPNYKSECMHLISFRYDTVSARAFILYFKWIPFYCLAVAVETTTPGTGSSTRISTESNSPKFCRYIDFLESFFGWFLYCRNDIDGIISLQW